MVERNKTHDSSEDCLFFRPSSGTSSSAKSSRSGGEKSNWLIKTRMRLLEECPKRTPKVTQKDPKSDPKGPQKWLSDHDAAGQRPRRLRGSGGGLDSGKVADARLAQQEHEDCPQVRYDIVKFKPDMREIFTYFDILKAETCDYREKKLVDGARV